MAARYQESRNDDKNSTDNPPMSRLFVICSKTMSEKELRRNFEEFGIIEEVKIVRNRDSGDSKGVAYVKYSKTSEAARALDEMHGKCIGDESRPIKVFVAANRQEGSKKNAENEAERCLRLFVVIPKSTNEDDLRKDFEDFGPIDRITVVRDKVTKEGKGYGFVKFTKFSYAALAFEGCSDKYKCVFAEPKPTQNYEGNSISHGNDLNSLSKDENEETLLNVVCSPSLNQDQLWRLFDIVPGLEYCQINDTLSNKTTSATVAYKNRQSASYAKDKIHGFEYPPGERLIIKMKQDESSHSNNDGIASVPLPPIQPLASKDSECLQRCFIICSPKTLPSNILEQTFCRVGDLIDVYLMPTKNYGYARYATDEAAQRAITLLNGIDIMGVRLKVLEAEEPNKDRKRMRHD